MISLLFTLICTEPTTLVPPPFAHTMGFTRISSFYLNMYLGSGFRVANPEGLCCAKMIEEEDTTTWRDDALLTLFAVNSGTGQIVYNIKLIKPAVYGTTGSGIAQFNNPHGIVCNEMGDVYVADTDNRRVVRLRYTQGTLSWVTIVDSTLNLPYDVSMDSRGNIYVTDAQADRIVIYDSSNIRIRTLAPGLNFPTGIAVLDALAPFNEFNSDLMVVIDRNGTRISRITPGGTIMTTIDCRRIGLDTAGFSYCAFDRYGNIYVTDRVNSQIPIFDTNPKYIT
ncbi:MAG: NHL repeat-containing protein, partial [candidate division WOR-3 bacterium]